MAGRREDQKDGQAEKVLVLRTHAFVLAAAGLVLTAFLSGCAGHPSYGRLGSLLARDDCDGALALMAESRSRYPANDALLFFLDSAMVNMKCQRFDQAQEDFRAAEDLAQALWTISLSQEVAALLTNDYLLAYPGEDFERAMIHMMSALAYLDQGKPLEALVECRRLNSLLSVFGDTYQNRNRYQDDPFGRYLSGLLREGDQDANGALIDYKKARAAFESTALGVPPFLDADLARAAVKAGQVSEVQRFLADFFQEPWQGKGMVVWIQLEGQVPKKEEGRILIPTGHGPLTIAFPRYDRPVKPVSRQGFALRSEGGDEVAAALYLVSDLGVLAVQSLEDRRARISAKAVARAAAKQALIHEIARKQGREVREAVRIALNFINVLVERADTRSWQTLPGQIYLGRALVDPGTWEAELGHQRKKILVKAGEIHYIVVNHSLGLL